MKYLTVGNLDIKGSKPERTIFINIRDWAATPFCSVSDLRAFRLKPLPSNHEDEYH